MYNMKTQEIVKQKKITIERNVENDQARSPRIRLAN